MSMYRGTHKSNPKNLEKAVWICKSTRKTIIGSNASCPLSFSAFVHKTSLFLKHN